ncbi:hypothetical protein [Marinifilum fragile]|uniref:hypothetical protein n=1 Tax=Marinifilum fragile TaxID=570161 RepID=UPI002AABD30F|nr:hypothetical protein [Marinifilum fragile]
MDNQFIFFDPEEYLRKQKQIFEDVLEVKLQQLEINNVNDEVLTPEMASKLLGKSRRTLEYWSTKNIIRKRFLAGTHSPYYLRSEIIAKLKEEK